MIAENIIKLRELVNDLYYEGDDIAFNKALAAIDLVIYDLMTESFVCAPRPARLRVEGKRESISSSDLDSLIDDISASLSS